MIRAAFQPRYWNAGNAIDIEGRSFSQVEANFSLFFGLALQLYQSTLVSDDTPFDRWAEGRGTLTPQQLRGFEVFLTNGRCADCHTGPEFTSATIRYLHGRAEVSHMLMRSGDQALYDEGFYNIGVRPTAEDRGVAALGAGDVSLSHSIQASDGTRIDPDIVLHESCREDGSPPPGETACVVADVEHLRGLQVAVEGSFKPPGLRNVALTGPYMHAGGLATLEQVIDFYARGGDFDGPTLHPDMKQIHLGPGDTEALVAFLESLTDERVAWEKAPFDHPSLDLPNGDHLLAVGRQGAGAPLPTFEERLGR